MKRADHEFVPALGWSGLTPFYDGVIRLLTRERVWRSANARPNAEGALERIIGRIDPAAVRPKRIVRTSIGEICQFMWRTPDRA